MQITNILVLFILLVLPLHATAKNYMASFTMENGVLTSANGDTLGENTFRLTESIANNEGNRYTCGSTWGSDPRCIPIRVVPTLVSNVEFVNRQTSEKQRADFRLFRISASVSGSTSGTSTVSGCGLHYYNPLNAGTRECTSMSHIKKASPYNVIPSEIRYEYELVPENPNNWSSGVWYSKTPTKFVSRNCQSNACNAIFSDNINMARSTNLNIDRLISFVVSVEPKIDMNIHDDDIELKDYSSSSREAHFKGNTAVTIDSNIDNLKIRVDCGTGLKNANGICYVDDTNNSAYLYTRFYINEQYTLNDVGKYYLLRNMKGVNTGKLEINVYGPKKSFSKEHYENSISIELRPWFK
ncbi:hypothetical protein BA953_24075 [Vibrio coralliilyticus]|nr:hypothetical protein BA953_24075 [Vibrio coralliilyticus]